MLRQNTNHLVGQGNPVFAQYDRQQRRCLENRQIGIAILVESVVLLERPIMSSPGKMAMKFQSIFTLCPTSIALKWIIISMTTHMQCV